MCLSLNQDKDGQANGGFLFLGRAAILTLVD